MELAKQAASIGHDVDLEREPDPPKPCADHVPKAARMNENGSMAGTAALRQEDDVSVDQAPHKGQRRKRLFLMFAGGLAIAGASWWGWATFIASDTEATENAYTNVEVSQVTPLVSAPVKRVLVVNSQHVRAGDTLVELDDTDLRLAAAQAEAALGQARRKVRQIDANDENLAGQEDARAADEATARADLARAQADLAKALTRPRAVEKACGRRRGPQLNGSTITKLRSCKPKRQFRRQRLASRPQRLLGPLRPAHVEPIRCCSTIPPSIQILR